MRMVNINIKALVAGIFLIISSQGVAETNSEASTELVEPLALKKIMQDMGKSMQVIIDGISREDWPLVVKTAPLIADHPQPPLGEKLKILMYVGTNVSKFKEYDGKTHAAASALGESATREDGYAVISDFATLQNTCLMCHQSFRKQFIEYFYGSR